MKPGLPEVTKTNEKRRVAVIVASGLYQQPVYPQLPGLETFGGRIMHSADYKGPEGLEGKRIVVIGGGSSGADIAAELSAVAAPVEMSARSGVWFVPHHIGGQPFDFRLTRLGKFMPLRVRTSVFRKIILNHFLHRLRPFFSPPPSVAAPG
jgi:cation diffusion facilitator CzcD-associated flavoprotein CzcO